MASTRQLLLKPLVAQVRFAAFASCMVLPAGGMLAATPVLASDDLQRLSAAELEAARELDWVPIDELTEEQKKLFLMPVAVLILPQSAPIRMR